MPTLRVTIDRVIHRTKDFYVLAMYIRHSEPHTHDRKAKASGHIAGLMQIAVGTTIQLNGDWIEHPKFGRQFSIHGWRPWAPDADQAFKFLFECVEGFLDYALVRLITQKFRSGTFEALSERQQEVLDLSTFDDDMSFTKGGISRTAMQKALVAWDRLRTVYELTAMLQDHGLESNLIQAVIGRFGNDARTIISQNPYRLLEVRGVTVAQADRVAQNMGLSADDPRRVQGAILASLRSAALDGHLMIRPGEIPRFFNQLAEAGKARPFDTTTESVIQAIRSLKQVEAIKVDPKAGVYLPEMYRFERGAAESLARFLTPVQIEVDLAGFLLDYQRTHRIDLSDAQREAVEKILQSRVLAVTGLPGTGKCVVSDTLVSGPWGFGSIGEFLPTWLRPDEAHERCLEVDTPSGVRQTAYIYNGGVTNTIRIKTRCGFELEGTPEHPVRVIRDGYITWQTLGGLKESDWVVLVRGPQSYSFGRGVALPRQTKCSRERSYKQPKRVTPLLGRLLGYLTSEGSTVSHSDWLISNFDYKVCTFLERALWKLFDYRSGWKDSSRDALCGVRLTSTFLVRWLRAIGVGSEYAHEKTIPTCILKSHKRVVVAYLSALFEGDGSVDCDRYTVEYGTSSETLSKQVQTLLLALGIVATRVQCIRGGNAYYRLGIYGEDYDRFRTVVGFHFTKMPVRSVASNTNKHLIPFYDRVKSVTPGKAQVVDFNVPEGHAFLSNGFISHNTTCLKAIVNLFDIAKVTYRLMAPTGIAAKRMASVTGRESATIHRTFGYDGNEWLYGASKKLTVDAVIIDEMSMVDMELFFRVLDALHPSTILVFVGDDAQLPSVGPGNVLRELLACPDVPNVRLTQIFRQSDAGGIVQNSHRINRGEELPLDSNDIEFRFVNIPEEDRITNLVVGMATKLKERDANFQVLAPKYDGVVGIDRLNDALRDRLNPDRGQPEWKVKTLHLREGDRVMVVQNDYQLGIYNGDMGKVMEFTKDDVIIRIHGLGSNDIDVVVEIPKSEAVQKLRLAYAISVHRSQGSEWETVILPITRTQGRMLQRNLFYTAVTRAKKRVWLLGHKDAVTRAVANDRVVQRNTVLARAISDAIQALKAAGVDDDGAGEAEGSARRLDAGTEGPIGEAPVGDTA